MYPRKHNHDYVNIVVEIAKGTATKYELSKELLHNPIMHDFAPTNATSPDKFRVLYKPIDWNYGFIPQTYADGDKLKIGKYKRIVHAHKNHIFCATFVFKVFSNSYLHFILK